MSDLLSLEWRRCPDGYQLRAQDPPVLGSDGKPITAFETQIVPVSAEVEQYFPMRDSDALFYTLAETDLTPKGVLSFARKYGLLQGEPHGVWSGYVHSWYEWIIDIRKAIYLWKSGDYEELLQIWKRYPPVQLNAMLSRPYACASLRLHLVPNSLLSGIWLQLCLAITEDAKLCRCNNCGKWFRYGSGTGRRRTAMYCSNRCRQAAHRARSRESAR